MRTRNRVRTTVAILGVFAFSFGIRLAHVAVTADSPFVRQPVGDAARYLEWAASIAEGGWVADQPFYQAPLYPYVLGVYFHVVDGGSAAVRALQAAWGSAACVLMALTTWRWFGFRAGLVGGALLAVYPPAIFYDSIVQKASLDGVLVCALLAAWPIGVRVGAGRAGLVGALAGLLCLTRENALAWLPWLAAGLAWRNRPSHGGGPQAGPEERGRRPGPRGAGGGVKVPLRGTFSFGAAAAFTVGAAAALAPAIAHNRAAGGAWIVTTSQAGSNFYIGNHRGADGRYVPLAPGRETPAHERDDARRLAEADAGRTLTSGEVSRHWFRRAWADIRSDPAGWARLMGLKLLMTWNRHEVADVESLVHQASISPVLALVTPAWHFGALAPLAALGVALAWPRSRRLWVALGLIALTTLAIAAFYVLGRYRCALALLLTPFAAAGLVESVRRVRARSWRRLIPGAAAALAVGVAANLPVHDEAKLDGLGWMNLGVAHARLGEGAAARACFEEAVRRHPGSSEANYNLGMTNALDGDWAGAIRHYEASLRGGKALPGVEFNLGVAYERAGRREDAARMFEAAAARDPSDVEAGMAAKRLRSGG